MKPFLIGDTARGDGAEAAAELGMSDGALQGGDPLDAQAISRGALG
jgi:hypothetical protein